MRPLALASVLVATDLDRSSDVALDSAHRLARAAGATLHVVHVADAAGEARHPLRDPDAQAASLVAVVRRAGIDPAAATLHTATGDPAEQIRAIAEVVHADVIVAGPHRRKEGGARDARLGGTATAIVLGASAPCLIAVEPLRLPLGHVVVPVDLSSTARGALVVGLSWASALRAPGAGAEPTTLTALHVARVAGAGGPVADEASSLDRELDALRREAGRWAGVRIEGATLPGEGAVARTIAGAALGARADLVVVGTRGLGLDAAARLGSVSASLVGLSPSALLLVPPAVWRAHGQAVSSS